MVSQSKQRQILGFIGWFVVSFAASAVGAVASIQAKSFYSQLAQPTWAPPPWLFGPVWTALYALMAIAAWLVWRSGGFRANHIALSLFLLQLALNALWSWFFFAWHSPTLCYFGSLLLPPSYLSGACVLLLALSSYRICCGSVSHLSSTILFGSSTPRFWVSGILPTNLFKPNPIRGSA